MHYKSDVRDSSRGIALVIVLAFVVLLAGLVAAYLGRTSSHRAMGQSSVNEAKADQLARSALDIVAGDLKQEISNGSSITAANILPQRNGTPPPAAPPIPNLVRISFQDEATGTAPMPAPGIPSRASRVNSTAPSLNGRSISAQRWNSHYLVPRATTSTSIDSTPISSFTSPDWVLVTAQGPQVLAPPASGVLGRYAYAIYDEGGLLDLNVAGFPYQPATPASAAAPGVPPSDVGRKGIIALADLTGLPTSPTVITASTSTPSSYNTATSINDLVGWRNYATVQPFGTFSSFTFDPSTASSGTGSRFLTLFLSNNNGFLSTSTTTTGGRTDQPMISRGELLELRSSIGFSQNILQYLGTYSRESNHQTWSDSATRLAVRFPLSRFDLFTNPTGNRATIQRYFGVVYVPASGPTPEHWQYFGASGTGIQPSISVLTGNQQDPDLSVLLRYMYPPASTPDSEILSIIASLIDQRDSDPNTTWIEYGDPASPSKAFGADSIPPTNPTDPRPSSPPVMLKRSFRNVGELGYAYRNASTTLDFRSATSPDASLLDLFTFNTASTRAGIINLNGGNIAVITALLMGATTSESSGTFASRTNAYHAAQNIVTEINRQNAVGRADVARLAGAAGTFLGSSDEARETAARVLAELSQTRTWNLLIDVIAQSGRYPANAGSLANFVVEGEKRYWLHIAIDRFTGSVIDKQLEAVYE